MERRSLSLPGSKQRGTRRTRRVLPLLAAGVVFLVSGCIDLTADMELNTDGSGILRMEYRLARELYEMGVFDQGSSYVPVPLHEEDFRSVETRTEGLSLDRYRIERNDVEVRIRTRIAFEDLDALNNYYSPGEERIRLETIGNQRRLTVDLHPGATGPVDDQTREFAESYLKDFAIRIAVEAPANIQSFDGFDGGESSRKAQISLPLSRLFTGDARQSVSLEWKREKGE